MQYSPNYKKLCNTRELGFEARDGLVVTDHKEDLFHFFFGHCLQTNFYLKNVCNNALVVQLVEEWTPYSFSKTDKTN